MFGAAAEAGSSGASRIPKCSLHCIWWSRPAWSERRVSHKDTKSQRDSEKSFTRRYELIGSYRLLILRRSFTDPFGFLCGFVSLCETLLDVRLFLNCKKRGNDANRSIRRERS